MHNLNLTFRKKKKYYFVVIVKTSLEVSSKFYKRATHFSHSEFLS